MTLRDRIAKAQGCGREDDPTQHDKPRQPKTSPWVQRALAGKLPVRVS